MKSKLSLFLFTIIVIKLPADFSVTADNDNCLICHDIPYLSIQESNGSYRSYEIEPHNYSRSIHRNVQCRDCHTDINSYPHQDNVETIDCSKSCHIARPFEETLFSHKKQMKQHENSVHGFNPSQSVQENLEKPSCKYCHSNEAVDYPDLNRLNTTNHCTSCHDGVGIENLNVHVDYHMTHRSASNSKDIVELCSSCHGDDNKMVQFGVNPTQVKGFEHQFHGKALNLGLDEVANCADCHSSHLVLPEDEKLSTLHQDNIVGTCSDNNNCHIDPTEEFSKAAVHSVPSQENSPILFYVEWGFIILTGGVMSLLFAHILLDIIRYIVDRRRQKV